MSVKEQSNSNDNIKEHPLPWNLLTDHHGFKIDPKLILKLTKGAENITDEDKENCEVLHLTTEWDFEELLNLLNGLNPQEYPNLFVVIIEGSSLELLDENLEKSKKIKESVLKFEAEHPLVLQLTSMDENLSKVYYQKEVSSQFLAIGQQEENIAEVKDFSFLLRSFLDVKIKNLDQVTAAWQYILKSPISLKFLKLFENLFFKLILEVTKSGTKADLLTVLDAPVEHEGRVLGIEAQCYLSEVLTCSDNESVKLNESDKNDSIAGNESQASSSVLLTAIEHKNTEIVNYLITYWSHLIQELPVDHQVRISTAACQTSQHEVLCDLLDIADFPLPEDYEQLYESHSHRLQQILKKRMKLKQAIKNENFAQIDDFIDNNPDLKLAFVTDDKSAMDHAFTLKKFKVFFYLKSVGYQTTEPIDIEDVLSEEELDQAESQAKQQKRRNVKEAVYDPDSPTMLLLTKSGIHNKRTSKDNAVEYRTIIRKWLEDLSKIDLCLPVLKVAASCDNLKIIFDFESETVERIDLSSNALGLAYSALSCNVFIGARLSNKKRQQEIRGILAHELCHYVMSMVYDNRFRPYYEHAKAVKEKFEEIVKAIDKWSAEDSEGPDDECNGIISSVFTAYLKRCFHLELIVRIVHILADFMDDPVKSAYLQEKYKICFDFWKDHVVPELRTYLKKDQKIIRLNGVIGLLQNIQSKDIQVRMTKAEQIINKKTAVITTNIPKLLLADIHSFLYNKQGCLLDSKNIFTDTEKFNNLEIWKEFERVCLKNLELNIIVDCTKVVSAGLENIFVNNELQFVFIVSSDSQSKELMDILKEQRIEGATGLKINYNWSDLTEEGQKLLLNIKIYFQNQSEISLKELLLTEINPETGAMPDLSEVIDDDFLNLMIDSKNLTINSVKEQDQNEKYFQFINIQREFLKKIRQRNQKHARNNTQSSDNVAIHETSQAAFSESQNRSRPKSFLNFWRIFRKKDLLSDSEKSVSSVPVKSVIDNEWTIKESKISQNDLLLEVQNQKYILVSDKAGNGKSWAMKNFTKILCQQNLSNWVTYVDLKQFIKEFKAQEDQEIMPEFATFMAENILKTKHEFESKIFQKLYKDGKVFILFDGFDEIAPNCAEFVSNLAQSFQSNEGNQLWIATRDYFEVDLMKKLKIDVAYGLEEMKDEEGINLIARNWMLMDFGVNIEDMTVKEFNQHVESSSKIKDYEKKAEQIVKKVKVEWNRSVGMPQMFKMIADAYKDEQNIEELKESKIFEKFIKTCYRRWSRDKGEIREEASIESQNLEFNFWKFHQYQAIASKFPQLVKILFPGYNGKDWSVEEVIACGILSTKNGQYYFIHETLREYFAADALSKALGSEEINDKILEVFVDVLTFRQCKIIRMFLNDLVDSTILTKFQLTKKVFILKKLFKTEIFAEFLTENLENLVDFVLLNLKDCDYKFVKNIFKNSSKNIIENTKNSKIFCKFQDFLCQFLTVNDLKDLIKTQKIFKAIIEGELIIEVFDNFVVKVEGKIGHEFVQKELRKAIINEWMQNHYLSYFFKAIDPKDLKFQKFMVLLQKFLLPIEVQEFFKTDENILLFCVGKENKEILRILWTIIENYFVHQNKSKDFKEFVMQQNEYQKNILHKIAESDNLEIHKIFWELLLNIFKNQREELKNFVLEKNEFGNNFVRELVIWNKNPEIIEWTLKMLKENFNDFQFQEFIQSKGGDNSNLIHSTAFGGQNIETFKHLWEIFRSSFKSVQEFWKVLKEVDDFGWNIFYYAAWKSPVEVFDFLIDEFEKNCSKEEIKKMLSNSDKLNRSLLYLAAWNESTETFKAVWKNLQKYLKSEEILEIAKQVGGELSQNFLFEVKSSETFEFAIEELEKIASRDEIRSLLGCMSNWKNQNILQNAAYWKRSLKLHETLWKILRKYFENSEIKNFIKNVDENRKNLLHCAVSEYDTKEVAELIWNEIKTFLNRDEQIKYLKIKGENGKNLIQLSWRDDNIKRWTENLIEEYGIKF